MAPMEVERKFRLPGPPPEASLSSGTVISQGYVFVGEGAELRIRRLGDRSYLTVKGDGTVSRPEWESELPRWAFDALWPATEGRRIQKTRHTIQHGAFSLEVDIFGGPLSGLVTLECEFADERSASEFVLPEWVGSAIEVTEEKAYKNKTLALRGMPKAL